MKKSILSIICIVATLALLASCAGNANKKVQEEQTEEAAQEQLDSTQTAQVSPEEKPVVIPEEPVFDMETTMGTIRIQLYSGTPKHRDNFVKLAMGGYYDGLLFHRVINGFMIQGGDPLTRDEANAAEFGTGGPGYTIPAEIQTRYFHKKGAIAAARRGDAANPMKESSGSQFYLVQDEMGCLSLDGEYTVFGETLSGLDVIDSIAAVPTGRNDRPLEDIRIISVKLVQE